MRSSMRSLALPLVALLISSPALEVAAQLCAPAPAPPPVDNRDGYLPMFEEAPIHPMEMNTAGTELWVANLPDASVSIFSIGSTGLLTYQTDIEVGLGPVTIRQRPGSNEMWIVCQSSNAVFVVNTSTRRLIDTVRTTFEPAGLVFDSAGTTAFVALSASNQVARINANTKALITPAIEVQSNMPAASGAVGLAHIEEPRALLVENNNLFVLSHRSGNGTLSDALDLNGNGNVFDIFNLWQLAPAILPPDRDVVQLDLNNPTNPGSAVLWRLGTLNSDLLRGPNGDLYVSTVDLKNDTTLMTFQYALNGFSTHAVVHATPSTNGLPQAATTTVDLNLPANIHPALQANFRCALPGELAINAAGTQLYGSCYESRNLFALDLTNDQVIGNLTPPAASSTGFGPRGVVLNNNQGRVYSYNRADNTVSVYNMISAAGQTMNPVQTVATGFDITPAPLLAGRRHMINAANSARGTETCNTCHPDGSNDGVAWDLQTATGDLPASHLPRDLNGIKVTMDLRGIEETPIYHWQGNRDDLADFNPAFAGLLGGSMLSPADLADFESFIFSLSYPPNPKHGTMLPTTPPRSYSTNALTGWDCFNTLTAHTVSDNLPEVINPATASRNLTCIECHGMSGASGTNNQVNNDIAGLLAEDATQLRGMFDKESDTVFYGTIGLASTGWGFSSQFFVQTIRQFLDFFPPFSNTQKDRTTDFLTEFDSGMAPSTAFVHTLTPSPTFTSTPISGYLIPEAMAGNSDLIARGWMMLGNPVAVPTSISMTFDPTANLFRTDRSSPASFTLAQLSAALTTNGALAFVGVPVGSGYRLGRDRDMDQLLDGDENRVGASTLSADTDGDGFPDGYERRFLTKPGNPTSFPPPGSDPVPPIILSPTVSWTNSRVAKIRWRTSEEANSRVRIVDTTTGTTVYDATESQFKTQHVMVARNLTPNGSFDVLIDSTDPANPPNTGSITLVNGAVTQPHLFQSLHIANTSLAVTGAVCQVPPGTQCFSVVTASFTVVDESNTPVQGATVGANFVEWIPGGTQFAQSGATGASGANGVATVSFTTLTAIGSGAVGEVIVNLFQGANAVTETGAQQRMYFHPLDGEFGFWSQISLP